MTVPSGNNWLEAYHRLTAREYGCSIQDREKREKRRTDRSPVLKPPVCKRLPLGSRAAEEHHGSERRGSGEIVFLEMS